MNRESIELSGRPVAHLFIADLVNTTGNEWSLLNLRSYIALLHMQPLQNQLEQARYAHVPFGNIPSDPALFVSDVFYSRHLLRHNHVLWASPTDKPDLGGISMCTGVDKSCVYEHL